MRSSIRTSLFLLLLPLAVPARAEDFVIYEARTRSADELKAAAAGVGNGARVSALGTKIVIYGSKIQRDEVLKLLSGLDHTAKNFRVSLRVARRGQEDHDASAVEVDSPQVRKKGGVLTGHGTGTVQVGGVRASAESGAEKRVGDEETRVTVTDGGSARVYADSGLFGNSVSVHVRGMGQKMAHVEIFDTNAAQTLKTEIDVPLGAWRTLGGLSRQGVQSHGEIAGTARQSASSSRDVQIRVDAD